MIVGDKSNFAIESRINVYHQEQSIIGIGTFLIHINGYQYGVNRSDATALANSMDSISHRLKDRGKHIAPFSAHPDPQDIAQAFRSSLYSTEDTASHYFGLPEPEFSDLFYSKNLIMAPDGDAAFDDSSYILQFDVGEKVRVIGFQCKETDAPSPETIRDAWVDADDFYSVLAQWQAQFYAEWNRHVKLG